MINYKEPTEISMAEALSYVGNNLGVGELYPFGGAGFDNEFVILFTEHRALIVPQEYLGASHSTIGASFNPTNHLVKEFIDIQNDECDKYYRMMQE